MEKLQQKTSILNLRDYQTKGTGGLHQHFLEGKRRPIYVGQTGSGKTVVISKLVKDHYEAGLPVIVYVRRRKLIKQASATFKKYGIPHGIVMAGEEKDLSKLVQICSIDTVSARGIFPWADSPSSLVIIDECHDCRKGSKKYQRVFDVYKDALVTGFTATPYGDNSWWDCVVYPIQAYELRDQGHLVPERTFIPAAIDVSKVRTTRGDFNKQELFEASSGSQIIGDIVKSWKTHGEGRPTLLFAVNVAHSKMIRDKFIEQGIAAEHHDANCSDEEREAAVAKLRTGEIKIITNCDIFSTGFDCDIIGCVQICRPSKSLIWHIQSIGRGLRISEGKKDCVIIDNAANTLRHGSVYLSREVKLGDYQAPREAKDPMKTCPQCFFVFPRGICPNCGYAEIQERNVEYLDGELTLHQTSNEDLEQAHFLSRFKTLANQKRFGRSKYRYIPSWEYQKLKKEFGVEKCRKYQELVGFPKSLLIISTKS